MIRHLRIDVCVRRTLTTGLLASIAVSMTSGCRNREPQSTPVADITTRCAQWADWCFAHDETPACITRVESYCRLHISLAEAASRERQSLPPEEPNPALMAISRGAQGYSDGVRPAPVVNCTSSQIGNQTTTRCR